MARRASSSGPIDRFTTRDEDGKYQHTPLSNFWEAEVRISGLYWKSVEHYYQAMKTTDLSERNTVWAAKTAGHAKKFGRRVSLRPDWDSIKLLVMRQALERKFVAGTPEGKYLLATKDRLLIEGNDWNDTFWGVDLKSGTGANWLGFLLMARRAQLRGEAA